MGGDSVLIGFDCSKWQSGVYSGGGGFTFGLAKATEGVGYPDPSYKVHLAALRNHGLVPGAYHFARPDFGNVPEAEADWFLEVVGDPRGMLLALDLEVGSGSLWSWRDRFCDRVETRAGRPCWWYSYSSFVGTRALNTSDASYPFWLAWPDSNGALPSYNFGRPRMQQYGLTGVPGIVGNVDANRFFGSLAELQTLAVGGQATPDSHLPIGGDDMALTITRADGSEDVFAVMPDGSMRHALWLPNGAVKVPWDDPLPGRWASVFKAVWNPSGTHLEVYGFGWQGGVGGSVWKNEWDVASAQWVGPTRVAG